ncbi:hemerythrin domain-containing protein [Actinocorallia aurantiaca]|uniref:Hemerythrin-like domain-containing protein n=1 Tax=Actinocorallia aurantiaca TaxID=46204 RepID=A0ABN3U4G4_9ACTN
MEDVFTALENGHREIRRMLRELESSPNSANGANQAALARRRQMVDRLIMEHSRHETAEQECFWPAVRELMANGEQLAEQGVRQEQAAQQMMGELRNIDPQEARFEEMLRNAAQDMKSHMDFEEQQVMPALRKVMDPQRAQRIGEQLMQSKQSASAGRARPHAAPRPGALKGTAQARGGQNQNQGQNQGQKQRGQNQNQGQNQNRSRFQQEQEQEEQPQGRQKPKDPMGGRGR